ncbi:MAG: SlyX family protein [Candidatus Nealsonbacteria bacterium]|nr:SlyX family protein [Candidatus Nealsonbacteria bacterium]
MEESDKQPSIETRLTALEESLMHVERTLRELNEATCSIQDRLDRRDRMLSHLAEETGPLEDGHAEKRTLEDDRPPHY